MSDWLCNRYGRIEESFPCCRACDEGTGTLPSCHKDASILRSCLTVQSLYGPATNKLVGEVDDDRISQTSKAFGA
eukprot:scaffold1042_cov401-Prasinococcus_capsulatus_cf.AAC.29